MASKKENKTDKKYFKEVKSELKKVTWPSLKEVVTSTSAVIVVVLIVALVVFLLDLCFEKINGLSVSGIQKVVSSFENAENSENTEINLDDENVEIVSDESVQLETENVDGDATTEEVVSE